VGDSQKPTPAIKGLTWHRHPYYSFLTPHDWHRFEWPDGRQGEIYGPDPHDPHTVAAVSLHDLQTSLAPDDHVVVAEGYFGALEHLPDVRIALRDQKVTGRVLMLEARYTFSDNGAVRKRWTRVIYHHNRQIALTMQGATPEKYDYWLPVFFEIMATANVHNQKPGLDFWGGS